MFSNGQAKVFTQGLARMFTNDSVNMLTSDSTKMFPSCLASILSPVAHSLYSSVIWPKCFPLTQLQC